MPHTSSGQQESLPAACEEVVSRLQSRSGYGFLEREEFAQKLFERISVASADAESGKIERLAKNVYADALYEGCKSKDGAVRNRAYRELYHYLYRVAYNMVVAAGCSFNLAQEVTQDALLIVHMRLGTVRQPGAFLAYAIRVLSRECKGRLEEHLKTRSALSIDDVAGMLVVEKADLSKVLDCLLDEIGRIPNVSQRLALTLKYFSELDDDRIARLLRTNKNNVYQLRYRALKVLRSRRDRLRECLAMESM